MEQPLQAAPAVLVAAKQVQLFVCVLGCGCLSWPWLLVCRVDGFCLDDGADMEPLTPTLPLFMMPAHPGHMARLVRVFQALKAALEVLTADIAKPSPSTLLQLDGCPLPYPLEG